jgi:hypothetical protein
MLMFVLPRWYGYVLGVEYLPEIDPGSIYLSASIIELYGV